MSRCFVAGCHRAAGRYSNLCREHRTVLRLRGHPEQPALSQSHLAQYLKSVRKRLSGPEGARVLSLFTDAWSEFTHAGTEAIRQHDNGECFIRHHHQAAIELRGLAEYGDHEKLLHVLVALFLLREYEPSFFKSDDAFCVMLQRSVRKTASGSYDLVWNATHGAYAHKLRGLPQRAALTLGEWFVEAFAPNCGVLAAEIYRHETRHLERNRQLGDALHELKRGWEAQEAASTLKKQRSEAA